MSPLTALLLLSLCCCNILAQSAGRCHPCTDYKCGMVPGKTHYKCPYGFKKDSCGCPLPSCQCVGCRYLDTTQYCQYGYRTSLRCPVNTCYVRPGPDMVRCPGPNDPTPPIGQFCGVSSECPIPQICCARWNKRNMCVTGIPIVKPTRTLTTPTPPCPTCPDYQCGKKPGQTPYTCPYGFKKGRCCTLPSCQCAHCPALDTTQYCQYGYRTRRGCPVNVCNVRPGPDMVRCPGPNDPQTPLGPLCRVSSNCPVPQVCCGRRNQRSVCRIGIPISPPCPTCTDHKCGKKPGQTPYTCPHGFKKDRCCTLSSCQCDRCPALDTTQYCKYGYRTRRGCPVNVCNVRPPPSIARCPRIDEPTGPVGPQCKFSSQCPAPQVCCDRTTGPPYCLNGIPI